MLFPDFLHLLLFVLCVLSLFIILRKPKKSKKKNSGDTPFFLFVITLFEKVLLKTKVYVKSNDMTI